MCEFLLIPLFIPIIVLIVSLLLSNFLLYHPKLIINEVYRNFAIKSIQKNVSNIITNEILKDRINYNVKLLTNTITEEVYYKTFSDIKYFNSFKKIYKHHSNISKEIYKNKLGIDKKIYDKFYHNFYDVNEFFFIEIKNNYLDLNISYHDKNFNIFKFISDTWTVNSCDLKFNNLVDDFSKYLRYDKYLQEANKNYHCVLTNKNTSCPPNYIKYDNILNYSQVVYPISIKDLNTKLKECCNY